jgi:putative hydrolase of the HAD superfamily
LEEGKNVTETRKRGSANGAGAIRAVIVDFGEVLCFRPEPEAITGMAKLFGIALEHFLEHYIPTRGPYDQGLLTPEEYWKEFARDAGVAIDNEMVEELRRIDTEMWSRINPDMTDWVGQLREAGLTTALLSNMQHDMAAHARANFEWMRHFDHQLLSCEMRLIKPDAEIFRRTIARIGVPPKEALFVDDRTVNVEAARGEGIKAIRFESSEKLRSDLRDMGFAILPRERRPKSHD